MKHIVILGLLAGCASPQIYQPSPARMQMEAACGAGNIQVCAMLENQDLAERQRRSSIPLPVYNANPMPIEPFLNNR
jgi:hypothetical protein